MASYTDSFMHIANGANKFTRRWGSSKESTDAVDPYITGYHFINFKEFPTLGSRMLSTGPKQTGQLQRTLESVCTSVTIPGATLNNAEFTGLGGTKFTYPTNADWDNTVSLRFTEWSGAVVHNIIHAWIKMICDTRYGINTSSLLEGTTKKDFVAAMWYWTTKPDGYNVDFHSLITGMYPTKDPTDQFGHDLATVDKLELDIDFKCDVIWQEEFTYVACKKKAQEYHDGGRKTFDTYPHLTGA